MRFAALVLSGALALAAAQSPVSLTPAQASQAACLKTCKAGDVNCQAPCVGVPNPDGSQVDATTKCAAACPQGDGSPAQTDQYAACVNKCIKKNYFTSGGTPQATGGSGGSASGTSSAAAVATQTGGSGSGSGATQTSGGSGSSPTGTGALAPAMTAAPVAVLGLVAAVLAL
ncbi:hypothetical protein TOPH_00138 [Tolypocladium ophioglossoides CBS 100239]|uniref:Uncharacterized protein n=1 Tax=Tolypocladium ophioglossoides (strain CBS 100239) TaxID=1163406 RepID=A0A0L0NM49_TOLOC|nr:hypothetical protein TOPH_00138 [Tolypocladium ophioglossoides CBS 100239]